MSSRRAGCSRLRGTCELPSKAVLFDGQALEPRVVAVDVVDVAHAGNVGFNDVDLLEWCDDEQLEAQLREKPKRVASRIVRASTERFVDHDEAKCVAAGVDRLELELVCE
jgi:hypothetical protein